MQKSIQPRGRQTIEMALTPEIIQALLSNSCQSSVFITLEFGEKVAAVSIEISPSSEDEEGQNHNAKLN